MLGTAHACAVRRGTNARLADRTDETCARRTRTREVGCVLQQADEEEQQHDLREEHDAVLAMPMTPFVSRSRTSVAEPARRARRDPQMSLRSDPRQVGEAKSVQNCSSPPRTRARDGMRSETIEDPVRADRLWRAPHGPPTRRPDRERRQRPIGRRLHRAPRRLGHRSPGDRRAARGRCLDPIVGTTGTPSVAANAFASTHAAPIRRRRPRSGTRRRACRRRAFRRQASGYARFAASDHDDGVRRRDAVAGDGCRTSRVSGRLGAGVIVGEIDDPPPAHRAGCVRRA